MLFRISDYIAIELGKMRHRCTKMQPTFGHSVSIFMLMLLSSSFLKCQVDAAVVNAVNKDSSSISDLVPNEPIKIKLLAPTTVSKKHTRTRQNSRFLRTFPPVELLDLARQAALTNEIEPLMDYNNDYRNPYDSDYYGSYDGGMAMGNTWPVNNMENRNSWPTKANRIDAGNSPIFYIKLPPVPYVFMPGVGYVSPHPYSNSPSMPMSMSAGQGMMPPGFGSFIPTGQESSIEQNQSVISLPLKFLSNGRPHQIESPKKKRRPGIKENSSENKAALISGGKYSFNGRPTAVFVVRSPVGSRTAEK